MRSTSSDLRIVRDTHPAGPGDTGPGGGGGVAPPRPAPKVPQAYIERVLAGSRPPDAALRAELALLLPPLPQTAAAQAA